MELTERATTIANKRIFLKDSTGKVVENFDKMCTRVSSFLANSPEEQESFFWLMNSLYFLPNSPCLVNAGVSGRSNQLSACYVLGVPDSIEGIFDTIKETALIHKHGGGTGMSFSRIRPKNSIVASTSGVASGPVSFMKAFDGATEAIKQGGVRRGANMGVLRVDHPDIEDFITAKAGKTALQNFNLSVAITNAFMESLLRNENYEVVNPTTGEKALKSAKKVFGLIVENAWATGDPGILFIDTINEHNPLMGDHNIIEATNPCGEQPLVPNEACGLGSINLSLMVQDDSRGIDYNLLHKVVDVATLFLNRMLEKSDYPNEAVRNRVLSSRKIGLGIMGFADMLLKLKVPYSSQDAQEIGASIMEKILDYAVEATHAIGGVQGTFPLFSDYLAPPHIRESLRRLDIAIEDYHPANSTLLTIAPTGTISIIANCTSGIEPIFHFEQQENRADTIIVHKHPMVEAFQNKYPTMQLPHYFEEAHTIPPETHVQIQATMQRYVCSAVSKTVNLPNCATRKDIEKIIKEAFLTGCKGVTVYRDGCLDNQVISAAGKVIVKDKFSQTIEPIPRPEVLSGETYQIRTGYGDMLVTVNYLNSRPFEIVCQLGKSGASEAAKAEAISRLSSILLRCGVGVKTIIEQLDGIVGSETVFTKYGTIKSIPDGLSKILINHVLAKDDTTPQSPMTMTKGVKCRDCKSTNIHKEGTCLICEDCGWRSCGE